MCAVLLVPRSWCQPWRNPSPREDTRTTLDTAWSRAHALARRCTEKKEKKKTLTPLRVVTVQVSLLLPHGHQGASGIRALFGRERSLCLALIRTDLLELVSMLRLTQDRWMHFFFDPRPLGAYIDVPSHARTFFWLTNLMLYLDSDGPVTQEGKQFLQKTSRHRREKKVRQKNQTRCRLSKHLGAFDKPAGAHHPFSRQT